MKIGIHNSAFSFSDRWIAYCKANMIDYKIVDCYSNDIFGQLSDCDALMWHFNHKGAKDSKFAKQLLYSVEISGKKVFPDFRTSWHFDDKVGQKYLLESIDAPLAPAYVFYSKQEALKWAETTSFPKVFKLRNGAGSDNVRLVRNKQEASKLIKVSFGRGHRQFGGIKDIKERFRKYRYGKTDLYNVIKGMIRLIYPTEYTKVTGREIGYIYFQEFIPDNKFDIRVIVIGTKAFAIKRMVRENDFRASGSGFILYGKEHFDEKTVRVAFEISDKLKFQCMSYDFVFIGKKPLIVEISYGFAKEGYDDCNGFWDRDMNWHEGPFNPYGWMIENIIKKADPDRSLEITKEENI